MVKIIRPTLLLDKQKCLNNIKKIVDKTKRSNVSLRPHFKTHQSKEIGQWFRAKGVNQCTVSSLKMADYFAADGWNDITVAFPLNHLEVDLINELANKIKLNLLVSQSGVLPQLLKQLAHKVCVLIDIDTGYHRSGIAPDDKNEIEKIINEIRSSDLLTFEGFLSHAGHTYPCKSKHGVEKIYREEVRLLNDLRDEHKTEFPELKLSIGDTPAASIVESFEGVDEIRAGNLVFYDLTQSAIGSCSINDIAVALACPVVANYPERNEIVIYGGGVHFSKDVLIDEKGKKVFGFVVLLGEEGWILPPTGMYVKSLSQEHGIISTADNGATSCRPGDVLGVLPVHSCLVADAMGSYLTLDGQKIEMMPGL